MNVKEFPAGTVVVQSEQPINALHVIAKGTVRATYPGGEFYLYNADEKEHASSSLTRILLPIRPKRLPRSVLIRIQ